MYIHAHARMQYEYRTATIPPRASSMPVTRTM